MRYSILLILALLVTACTTDNKKAPQQSEAQPKVEQTTFGVPGLPQSDMKNLYDNATYVDYIFYNLPFSLSQDNKPSIHANLALISPEPLGSIPASCKPIGREFFQVAGEVAYEADLYFQEGCYGYVFIKDKKPLYANKISSEGIKFYGNLINQANQTRNQMINGQQ